MAISFPLSELEAQLRVGLKLWLGLGLAASISFMADCRNRILGDRLPVAGKRHTTLQLLAPDVYKIGFQQLPNPCGAGRDHSASNLLARPLKFKTV